MVLSWLLLLLLLISLQQPSLPLIDYRQIEGGGIARGISSGVVIGMDELDGGGRKSLTRACIPPPKRDHVLCLLCRKSLSNSCYGALFIMVCGLVCLKKKKNITYLH